MLDSEEGRALIILELALDLVLLLDGLVGGGLSLLGRRLVGVVSISSRGSGLLALGRGRLLRGGLGGTSLAHDLSSDREEGDGRRIGVLEAGHVGKLLVVDLVHEAVSHDLVSLPTAALVVDTVA